MKTSALTQLACGIVVGLVASGASAQTIFWNQSFETDTTANWTVNTLGTGSDANFFFDYSTVGIPKAPNSDPADGTFGLRLRANQFSLGGTFPGGVSVSPTGQSFSGDYILRFDLWLNFNGPAPAGGTGSTQVGGAGIGTAGGSAQIAGGVVDSIFFGSTGEGGSSVDYRVYAPLAQTGYGDASGVFAAGTTAGVRNNTHAYYAGFGGESAPAAQLALYSQQTGTTAAGTLGWAWREVEVAKLGDTVTWTVDGLLIATVDATTAGTLGGDNILFNQFDINATTTDAAGNDLLFGLYDNVVVFIPEPTTTALALLGGAGLFFLIRRRR
jgi:hypothetical protein